MNLKVFILLFFLIGFKGVFSQNNSAPSDVTLFAQAIFSIDSKEQMLQLEAEMRQNPYIKLVRLDWNTQRLFLLTQNINELTEIQLLSWFNGYVTSISCVQIGIKGVDEIQKYPFTNCEN